MILAAIGQDVLEDVAPAKNETGLVVAEVHAERGVQHGIEDARIVITRAFVAPHRRAPALHDVDVRQLELALEPQPIFRLILQIRVEDSDQPAARGGDAGLPRGGDALVLRVAAPDQERVLRLRGFDRGPGAVGGAVVDQHQLAGQPAVIEHLAHPVHELGDVRFFVQTGDDDRQIHRAESSTNV